MHDLHDIRVRIVTWWSEDVLPYPSKVSSIEDIYSIETRGAIDTRATEKIQIEEIEFHACRGYP